MKYFFKTCLTAAILWYISAGASAQSFTISDEKPQSFDNAQLAYKFTLKIHNETSTEKLLKVTENTEEVMPEDESYFCVGTLCLPPQTNEYEEYISANGTFDLYVYLKDVANVNGIRKVNYTFSDSENPADKIERKFIFQIGTTSVGENSKGVICFVSSPMPNPAFNSATIQYSITESSHGAIELYSADSKLLKTFTLESANNSLVIPTAELPAGIYFYALVINGEKVATDKLVIAR